MKTFEILCLAVIGLSLIAQVHSNYLKRKIKAYEDQIDFLTRNLEITQTYFLCKIIQDSLIVEDYKSAKIYQDLLNEIKSKHKITKP